MKCKYKPSRLKDFKLVLTKGGKLMVKRKYHADYYSLDIFKRYVEQGVIKP